MFLITSTPGQFLHLRRDSVVGCNPGHRSQRAPGASFKAFNAPRCRGRKECEERSSLLPPMLDLRFLDGSEGTRVGQQVFISYARGTSADVATALADARVETFLDTTDIDAGESIPAGAIDAPLGARVVVVFADTTSRDQPLDPLPTGRALSPERVLRGTLV